MGEILGETEEPQELVQREPGGAAVVRGDAPIREVNRAMGLDLPEGDGFTSVGGLCVALAGAVPERGTRLTTSDGAVLEVLEASPRVVRRLRIVPPASPASAS